MSAGNPSRPEDSASEPITIAITATFTAEPMEKPLRFWMQETGLSSKVRFAPYNQVFQQLLDPTSLLSRNRNGINVILVRLEDWGRFENSGEAGNGKSAYLAVEPEKIEQTVQDLITALHSAATRSASPHLVCFCPASTAVASDPSLSGFFRQMEQLTADSLRSVAGIYVLTSAELASTYPVSQTYDPHADDLGHVPYTPLFFTSLGTLVARKIHALRSPRYKVIALDCDQTLWKGVCGEDGASGVEIDPARRALQEFMVRQHDAGMLLCLCSKNNEKDVLDVFTCHAEMPLKLDHIAASRINWKSKSENLRSLAREFQLGLDTFVLIDDDPIGCEEVRISCPEVLTLQLPMDSGDIPAFLSHVWAFDQVAVTLEDSQRTVLYKENAERERYRSESRSLEDFLNGLDLQISISEPSSDQLGRVSQLTRRTNQFNCTLRRRSPEEIQQLGRMEGLQCRVVEVKDRFGDYGLVGAIIYRVESDRMEVDTFLLSCRALGRGVEHRMLADLGEIARHRGLQRIDVPYTSARQNQPALDFLNAVGAPFKEAAANGFLFRFPAEYAASLTYRPALTGVSDSNRLVEESAEAALHEASPATRAPTKSALFTAIAAELRDAEAVLNLLDSRARQFRPELETEFVAARSPLEETLAEIWAEVLAVDRVGIYDNFFELGGESLTAIQLISRVRMAFDVDLPIAGLFDDPTVDGMTAAVLQACLGQEDPDVIAQWFGELDQRPANEPDDSPHKTSIEIGRLQPPRADEAFGSGPARASAAVEPVHATGAGPSELYRRAEIESFPFGGGHVLVHAPKNRSARVLTAPVLALLDRCTEFKPLAYHARDLCRELQLGQEQIDSVRRSLSELLDSGFLVTQRDLLRPFGISGDLHPPTKISTIAIPTCDRVEALERCLTGYIESSKKYGRAPDIAIMDNSDDAATRDAYRRLLGSLLQRHGLTISYAGLEEKIRFTNRLAEGGDIPLDVARFALFGVDGETFALYGGNRNALLLHTVGDAVFATDDDTACRVCAAPESSPGISFTGGRDPADYWIFPDRETALRAAPSVEEDIFTVHEKFLGRSLASILSSPESHTAVDLARIDSRLLRKLQSGTGKVLATINGTLGDCAWGPPFGNWGAPMGYLLFEGRSRERLVQSEAFYRSACLSREMLRVATRPTISDGACSLGTFMGLDNRDLLPPHTPVGKGLDLTFGVNLWRCFDDGYFAHLPYALLHAPLTKRRFWPGEIFRSASGYDVDKLMIDCIESFEFGSVKLDGEQRLQALGKHLIDMGSMPLKDFEEFLRAQIWRTTGSFLSAMEERVRVCGGLPEFWAKDVKKYMDIARRSVVRQDYCIPLDLMLRLEGMGPRELSQLLVFKFGQLMYWWPHIVEAAKRLKARGEPLASPV